MIPLAAIGAILVAHFIADFIFQTQWMALNKSTTMVALTAHVIQYTITMGAIVSIVALTGMGFNVGAALGYWIILNGLAHFCTDALTSRASKAAFESGNNKRFWIIIGADQMTHGLCLFGSYVWLLT